ncbi:hypothetical protein [Paraburkholderia fungorum]|uniref:hypothetical protein n=1 Tax=Paraburkholderia fungorum TaxID=134537 RepID=UPI003313E006
MFNIKARRQLAAIKQVCECSQAGVFKRIDENRELLELLKREAPALMAKCPWVEAWIASQDEFLSDLADAAAVASPLSSVPYPRPWPGDVALRFADRARTILDSCIRRVREKSAWR